MVHNLRSMLVPVELGTLQRRGGVLCVPSVNLRCSARDESQAAKAEGSRSGTWNMDNQYNKVVVVRSQRQRGAQDWQCIWSRSTHHRRTPPPLNSCLGGGGPWYALVLAPKRRTRLVFHVDVQWASRYGLMSDMAIVAESELDHVVHSGLGQCKMPRPDQIRPPPTKLGTASSIRQCQSATTLSQILEPFQLLNRAAKGGGML